MKKLIISIFILIITISLASSINLNSSEINIICRESSIFLLSKEKADFTYSYSDLTYLAQEVYKKTNNLLSEDYLNNFLQNFKKNCNNTLQLNFSQDIKNNTERNDALILVSWLAGVITFCLIIKGILT